MDRDGRRDPRLRAAAGSLLFLGVAPGVVAVLLLYALVFGVTVGSFVHLYEQPTLARQFGAEYDAYRDAVPAWLPRRTPWRPQGQRGSRERS